MARRMIPLKYSCEEIYDRMSAGLCIFCEDLDTPGHHDLRHKGVEVIMIESDDQPIVMEDDNEPIVEESLVESDEFVTKTMMKPDSFSKTLESSSSDLKIFDVAEQKEDQNKSFAEENISFSLGEKIEHMVGKQSQEDKHVWEPGGLPTKADQCYWPEKRYNHHDMLQPVRKLHMTEFKTFRRNDEAKGDEFMNETLPLEDDVVTSESGTRDEPALDGKPLFDASDGLATIYLDSFVDVTLVNLGQNQLELSAIARCRIPHEGEAKLNCYALLETRLMRVQSLEKQKKCHKTWKFKYKQHLLLRVSLEAEQKQKKLTRKDVKDHLLALSRGLCDEIVGEGQHISVAEPEDKRLISIGDGSNRAAMMWGIIDFQGSDCGSIRHPLFFEKEASRDRHEKNLWYLIRIVLTELGATEFNRERDVLRKGLRWPNRHEKFRKHLKGNRIHLIHAKMDFHVKDKLGSKTLAVVMAYYTTCEVYNILSHGQNQLRNEKKKMQSKSWRFKYKYKIVAMGVEKQLHGPTDQIVVERIQVEWTTDVSKIANSIGSIRLMVLNQVEMIRAGTKLVGLADYHNKKLKSDFGIAGLYRHLNIPYADAHKLIFHIKGYGDRDIMTLRAVGLHSISLMLFYGSLPRPPDFRMIKKNQKGFNKHEMNHMLLLSKDKLLLLETGFWSQYKDLEKLNTRPHIFQDTLKMVINECSESLAHMSPLDKWYVVKEDLRDNISMTREELTMRKNMIALKEDFEQYKDLFYKITWIKFTTHSVNLMRLPQTCSRFISLNWRLNLKHYEDVGLVLIVKGELKFNIRCSQKVAVFLLCFHVYTTVIKVILQWKEHPPDQVSLQVYYFLIPEDKDILKKGVL